MLQSSLSASSGLQNPFRSEGVSHGLTKLVYRSRATKPMSPAELHDLTVTAQVRNDREGITGVLLHDNGRFFQWLEGPASAVENMMRAIRRDSRHTDVEVMRDERVQTRTFAAWGMKLATLGHETALWHKDVIEPPADIIEGLRRRPDAASAFLVGLASFQQAQPDGWIEEVEGGLPLNQKMSAVLRNVFLSAVIPLLGVADAAHLGDSVPAAHPRAAELAELLVSADGKAAQDLINELRKGAGTIGPMAAALLEPAARSLGDLWSEDFCTEFDVTLGLCRLQSAVRLLTAGASAAPTSRTPRPAVLIAPEPGELHRLGAALDSTVLRKAGWAPHSEYPDDDNALRDMLSSNWFDVLDLSLSAAFRRDQDLPRVAHTIAEARRASQNPALVVVVGGRVFVEEKAAMNAVGADQASTTAMGVNRTILKTISEMCTSTASVSETLQAAVTPS